MPWGQNTGATNTTKETDQKMKPTAPSFSARRELLLAAASTASIAIAGCMTTGATPRRHVEPNQVRHEGAEITPNEGLMQEHGVIERILLIYDEAGRRIDRSEQFDLAALTAAAAIVRRFVEDYHEKLEEQFVFPRLQTARRELDLVAVLLRQHTRGRQLTDEIVRRAGAGASAELGEALRRFSRIYRPHAAREETVVFPVFREVVGRVGYRELGEEFEYRARQLFGAHGFKQIADEVANLEESLGIFDLASLTPA